MSARRYGGFSLVEMVVSISLVALFLLGIVGLIPTGIRSLAKAGQVQTATMYGVEVMEDGAYEVQTDATAAIATPFAKDVLLNKTSFHVERTITQLDSPAPGSPSRFVQIDVVVNWNGQPVPITFSSRVFNSYSADWHVAPGADC